MKNSFKKLKKKINDLAPLSSSHVLSNADKYQDLQSHMNILVSLSRELW